MLSRFKKLFLLYFWNPSYFLYLTKSVFFFFFFFFVRFTQNYWLHKYVWTYFKNPKFYEKGTGEPLKCYTGIVWFKLTCYEFWWGKLGKYYVFFQVWLFLTDKIVQKLPKLMDLDCLSQNVSISRLHDYHKSDNICVFFFFFLKIFIFAQTLVNTKQIFQ